LAFFLILGAIGFTAGAWPLLTGRNYPGLMGRGFTKGDDLRLNRAPAIYFRAMGATIASAGLCMFALSVMLGLSSDPSAGDLGLAVLVCVVCAIWGARAAVWLILLAHRHKLGGCNAP
jgi:hypothetical protein